jgi:RNA polymerase sigma-70 factor (ECF subfamily)
MTNTTLVKTSHPQTTDAESDDRLLVRYRDHGDVAAFETLVHRYEQPLYSFLLRYLGMRSLAEEVFQATFLRLHEKRRLFTDDRRLRPWLYSIALHQAVDALRKEGRQQAISLDEERPVGDADPGTLLRPLRSGTASPLEEAEERERAAWARAAVATLPEALRVVVLLIYFQGLKFREAADALHLPLGTIKSRIHQALARLNAAWRREHPQT